MTQRALPSCRAWVTNRSGGRLVQDRGGLARAAQMDMTGSIRCGEPRDGQAVRVQEGPAVITAKGFKAILLLWYSTKILHVTDATCLLFHVISSCPQWLRSWLLLLPVSFSVRTWAFPIRPPRQAFLLFVFESCLTFSLSIILQQCLWSWTELELPLTLTSPLNDALSHSGDRWEMGRIWGGKA